MKGLNKINKMLEYLKNNIDSLKKEADEQCPEGGLEHCNTLESQCNYRFVCQLIKQYYTSEGNDIQKEEITGLINILMKLKDPINRQKTEDYINDNYCPYSDDVECDPLGIQNDSAKNCPVSAACELLCSGNLLTEEERERKIKELEFDERYRAIICMAKSMEQEEKIAEKNSKRDISNLFL